MSQSSPAAPTIPVPASIPDAVPAQRWSGSPWFAPSFALGVSFCTHLTLILVLAFILIPEVIHQGHSFTIVPGEAGIQESSDSMTAFDVAAASGNPEIDQEVETSYANVTVIASSSRRTSDSVQMQPEFLTSPSAASQSSEINTVEKAGQAKLGKGRGLSSSGGTSFFGIGAGGDRFVFVVDSSRSMMGERWEAACSELIRSVRELGPDQRFYLLCFDVGPRPVFDEPPSTKKYLLPNSKTIPRVRRWLASLELGRNTLPAEALRIALAMEPDAIFLLSDGELKDETMAMLQQINVTPENKPRIPIHAVSLLSDEGTLTLQMIAAQNGGQFKSVRN